MWFRQIHEQVWLRAVSFTLEGTRGRWVRMVILTVILAGAAVGVEWWLDEGLVGMNVRALLAAPLGVIWWWWRLVVTCHIVARRSQDWPTRSQWSHRGRVALSAIGWALLTVFMLAQTPGGWAYTLIASIVTWGGLELVAYALPVVGERERERLRG